MSDADQIETLLAEHQDRMDADYVPKVNACKPPEGRFVVNLAFSGEFVKQNDKTEMDFVTIPTYFRITEVLSLSDHDFSEEDILKGDGLLIYGPTLSTDVNQEWTRDGFFGLASLVAGKTITTLTIARSVISAAVRETKDSGLPYRFVAEGKKNNKGYVNLTIRRRHTEN